MSDAIPIKITYTDKKYAAENFKPIHIHVFDIYDYEIKSDQYPPDLVLRSRPRQFTCAHGTLWYTYNHFPDNCGVGVYSNIIPQTVHDHVALNREFVHFMQHTCDKDMILLTDHLEGVVDRMAKDSEGELVPIGKRVVNDNTENYIKVYQTVRKSTDYLINFDISYINPKLRTQSKRF